MARELPTFPHRLQSPLSPGLDAPLTLQTRSRLRVQGFGSGLEFRVWELQVVSFSLSLFLSFCLFLSFFPLFFP